MKYKTIIGLVGEIAAGKTTITNYLKEKYEAKTFRFSDMLRDVLKRMHLPDNRQNMQTISTILRQNFSEDIMSQVLTADVQEANYPIIITEGIRRPSDVVYLKKLDNFHIIAIKTDEKIRFERLTKRSENPDDKIKTWEQFQEESKKEPEQKIKEMIEQADFSVDNNGSTEKLYKQIDEVIKKILV
jgi:dephospho-CoA kinase